MSQISEGESNRLGFLSLVQVSEDFIFSLDFNFVLDLVIELGVFQRREREIL